MAMRDKQIDIAAKILVVHGDQTLASRLRDWSSNHWKVESFG